MTPLPGRRRIALWAMLALLAALLSARAALAHPQIVRIEPPPDAELDRPPGRLRIIFSEPLESLSALELRDARGRAVAGGGAPLAEDPATLGLDLPSLGPGVYTMVWTVVGSDGHIVKGNASFQVLGGSPAPDSPSVGAAPPATPVAPAPDTAPEPEAPPLGAIALRGLMLLGAAAGVGGMAFRSWLLGPALRGAGVTYSQRGARPWLAAALLICGLAACLMLVVQAQAALGRGDLAGVWRLSGTRYGALLVARACLAVALAAAAALPGEVGRLRGGLAVALGAGLLLSFSLGGHAAAQAAPLLPVLADAIHLGATALWAGGLLAFAAMMPAALRAAPEGRRPALLGAMFARFSALGLASAALLSVTGAYAALRALGAPSDLWSTPYGLALAAKLAAFGAMLLLGAYHLLVARPGLRAWAAGAAARPWARLLGRSLRAEAALGALAIVAAGALTALAPPADAPPGSPFALVPPTPTAIRVPTATPGPTRTPVPSQPFDQTQSVGDLRVRLEVSPASIGDDRFRVTVTDRGGEPVEAQLVRLSFEMLAMDMGQNQLVATPEAPASYAAEGAPLSMVGDWQVTVTVRRAGVADVQAVFSVPVGE